MNGLRGREEVRKSYGINMGYTGRSFTKWSQVAAHTHTGEILIFLYFVFELTFLIHVSIINDKEQLIIISHNITV